MSRVLVADALAEDGLDRLRAAAEVEVRLKLSEPELVAAIPSFDALVVRSETGVTRAVLEAGTALRVVGRAGVGIDNIDLEAATERGILVVNAPRGNIVAAAEHTMALLLAVARWVPQADASMKRGEWTRSRFMGVEVRGKTLGIVGLGNVGTEVAKRAQGLEMEVIAYDPAVSPERAQQLGVELLPLADLLRRADFLTVHAPLVEGTRHLLGEPEFQLVKPTLRLVNVARGGIVDETALYQALAQGHLAGAALDVFEQEPPGENPLLGLPQVITTPHLGASTAEAQTSVAFDVAEQVLEALRGELPRYAINAPSLSPDELSFLRPYVALTEALGSLYRQLRGGTVSRLELQYSGPLADHDVRLLSAAAIKGLLAPFTDQRINPVNAHLVAGSHGIRLDEHRRHEPGRASVVTLVADGFALAGTGRDGDPVVERIGEFRVDLPSAGRFLVSRHRDQPGIVGRVGTVLGEHDINIASMQVGRDAPRGSAMMILAVDDPVGAEVQEALRAVPGVADLRYIELG